MKELTKPHGWGRRTLGPGHTTGQAGAATTDLSRVPLGPAQPFSQIWASDFGWINQEGPGNGVLEMEQHLGKGGTQTGVGGRWALDIGKFYEINMLRK